MNKIIYFTFGFFTLLACQKASDNSEQHGEICELREEIVTPPGFEITPLGSIDIDGSVHSLQFINNQLGYALASHNYGGYVRLFKTTDGGHSWQSLGLDIDQIPLQMLFKNENYGLITLRNDCQDPDCDSPTVVLRTQDGGANWEELRYDSLRGNLYFPQYDNEGRLYAVLLKFPEGTQRLMRSADDGQSWHSLYHLPDYQSVGSKLEFQLYQGKIYFLSQEEKILIIDSNGVFQKSIVPPATHPHLTQLTIISGEQWLLSTHEGLYKTSDAGNNWTKLLPEWSQVVGFMDSTILAMETTGQCPVDYIFSSDRFTGSSNGGVSWIPAPATTTNLMTVGFADSFEMSPGHWRVIVDQQLLSVKAL